MSDLLARIDSMIEALAAPGSSRCSRSMAPAQTPTGTDKPLQVEAVPVVPGVPAEKQNIIRDADISRTEEQSRQHAAQGKAPLSLSSKRTGTTGTTGTGQDFCGVERSRHFISSGNNGNSKAWPEPEIPHAASPPPRTAAEGEKRDVPSVHFIAMEPPPGRGPIIDLMAIDEERFNERAAVLEFEGGLSRDEAERRAAAEMGVASPAELFAAIAAGWAERLHEILASERSPRGRECIAAALRFIEGGWAVKALACGWTELGLLGFCAVAPWERLDRMGAAYSTFAVAAVTPEAITYATSGAEPLRRLPGSQADGAVLPWEHVERDKPPLFETTERLDHLPEPEL